MSLNIEGHIRTVVPAMVAALLTWLADTFGIVGIDGTAATAFAVSVVLAVYYALARELEARWPQLGWLLGLPRPPAYDKG